MKSLESKILDRTAVARVIWQNSETKVPLSGGGPKSLDGLLLDRYPSRARNSPNWG